MLNIRVEELNDNEASNLIGLRESIEKSGRSTFSERLNDFIVDNYNIIRH